MGTPRNRTIMSEAPKGERATTIPKGSTFKRMEAGATITDDADGYDIVCSLW